MDFLKSIMISGLLLVGVPMQAQQELVVQQLAQEGFTNVRGTETDREYIFTIENDRYKLPSQGLRAAVQLLEQAGLDSQKTWRIVMTHYNVPQVQAYHEPQGAWQVTADVQEAWQQVKGQEKKNSSLFNVDIKVYPQLALKNLIVNQVYQWMFDLSPAVEVSFWPGMKLSAMLKIPVYNDGYGMLEDKVHPGQITLSQRFRVMDRLQGRVTVGTFSNDRYGVDANLKYQFKDPRFSVEGQLGNVGLGYWNGMKFHYLTDMKWVYKAQANFYWPRYNTQFSLKYQNWLLGDNGVKFEMIRHFRYTSIGFYAMKAVDCSAKTGGGFRFQVALPPYKMKRYKHFPILTTSNQMGLIYNASNEQAYYREYKAEASDNIMEANQFNPIFLQNELNNK